MSARNEAVSVAPHTHTEVTALERRLTRTFALTWLCLCVLLGALTTFVYQRAREDQLDQELRLAAMATYGLAYFDATGTFQSSFLEGERAQLPARSEIWMVSPRAIPPIVLRPEHPVCSLEDAFVRSAPEVVEHETADYQTLDTPQGRRCRVRRLRTYTDAGDPIAAIYVASPIAPVSAEVQAFALQLWLGMTLVCAIGLFMARRLSRRAVLPMLQLLSEREHYLRAAAHELRTPLARLRVAAESVELTGPESLPAVVLRVVEDADQAASLLLRSAELSTSGVEPRAHFRLDLLAEVVANDEIPVASEQVVVLGNAAWIRIALENVVRNATLHGAGATDIRVTPDGVFVVDEGPGFSAEELAAPVAPFRRGARSRGTGLGLALATDIMVAHGGTLTRRNLPGGGAEVGLRLRSTPTL